MICSCTELIKKRTLLDGIKSLEGKLHVFIINSDRYIKECCFKTLIPSLYTLINNKWFITPQTIVAGDNYTNLYIVFKISDAVLSTILTYATEDFHIVEHIEGFKLIESCYSQNKSDLNLAYQTIIKLEKELKDQKYKLSAIAHDNNILTRELAQIQSKDVKSKKVAIKNEETELMKREDRINSNKINNKQCNQCKTFAIIKDDLKLLKHENHEKIALAQYEHEIALNKMNEMRFNMEIIQEENIRLKEENKLLRATSTIYSYDLENHYASSYKQICECFR